MAKKLNVLVIGAGERGNAFSDYIKKANLEIEIIGVGESIKERAKIFAKKNSIKDKNIFSCGKDAIKSKIKVDFIYLATPDSTHKDLAVFVVGKRTIACLDCVK